jgi:hypothetical protein
VDGASAKGAKSHPLRFGVLACLRELFNSAAVVLTSARNGCFTSGAQGVINDVGHSITIKAAEGTAALQELRRFEPTVTREASWSAAVPSAALPSKLDWEPKTKKARRPTFALTKE